MASRQALGVDHRQRPRELGRQAVVVGNDRFYTLLAGVFHRRVGRNAGVAGDQKLHTRLQKGLQEFQVDPV